MLLLLLLLISGVLVDVVVVVVVVVAVGGGSGMARMSIGMLRRWQAKMAFITGMYWWARSAVGEAEMRRMRDWRREGEEVSAVCCVVGSVATPTMDSV